MSDHQTLYRQWRMLSHIPRHRYIDTATLKSRLENEGFDIHPRSLQRDLKSLSLVFPLESDERSKPFGWRWAKGANVMDIPGMDPPTALTFVLAKQFLAQMMPPAMLQFMEPHFKRATTVIKQNRQKGLRAWPSNIRIQPKGLQLKPASINPKVQAVIYEALQHGVRFTARYHSRENPRTEDYEVNPLGLVFRHGVVYLVCTLWDYDDLRQMALHRFEAPRLLDVKTTIPNKFSLDRYIDSGAFGYPHTDKQLRLKARFAEATAAHLYETPLSENQVISKADNGWVNLVVTIDDTEDLRWWLLGFGDQVQVLAPSLLRKEMKTIVQNMNKFYKSAQ